MGEYINKYANSAAIQNAVDGGELIKPYVALDESTGLIDWNTKYIDYANMPLTFEIISGGTIVWKTFSNYFGDAARTISYSLNGREPINITSTTGGTTISVEAGDTVQLWGNNSSYAKTTEIISTFSNSTIQFKAKGNIMSLVNSTNFSELTAFSNTFVFSGLFSGCTGLIDISKLLLPATTLTPYCYNGMFRGCTSLTTAPELPATTLAERCYSSMFQNCTNLNYIKCLATDISATKCTYNWLNSVASSGTFVTPSSTNWTTGRDGIPTNWTRVDA